MTEKIYRVAIIGTGRMGGLIEDELAVNQFSSPYGHRRAPFFGDAPGPMAD